MRASVLFSGVATLLVLSGCGTKPPGRNPADRRRSEHRRRAAIGWWRLRRQRGRRWHRHFGLITAVGGETGSGGIGGPGGTTDRGGTPSPGGSAAAGGARSNGGSSASGGRPGGTASSGGATPSGGATASGGLPTSGGITASGGQTGTGTAPAYQGPCDVLGSGCAEAYSVSRAMTASYTGPLFQLGKASDKTRRRSMSVRPATTKRT